MRWRNYKVNWEAKEYGESPLALVHLIAQLIVIITSPLLIILFLKRTSTDPGGASSVLVDGRGSIQS